MCLCVCVLLVFALANGEVKGKVMYKHCAERTISVSVMEERKRTKLFVRYGRLYLFEFVLSKREGGGELLEFASFPYAT